MQLDSLSERPSVVLISSSVFGLEDMRYLEDRFEKALGKSGVRIARMSDLKKELLRKCFGQCGTEQINDTLKKFITDTQVTEVLTVETMDTKTGQSCSYTTKDKMLNMPEFGKTTVEDCSTTANSQFPFKLASIREKKNVLLSEVRAAADTGSIEYTFSDAKNPLQQTMSAAIARFVKDPKVRHSMRLDIAR